MTEPSRAGMAPFLIMVGVMLGAGIGAAFGHVAIGLPAGMAVGSLAALALQTRRR